jgi:hypothetical protein
MATSDELRKVIAASAATFRESLESFKGDWETIPSGDAEGGDAEEQWTAREIAEHTIKSVGFFAGLVADTMQARPAEKTGGDLLTVADAITSHDEALAILNRVFKYVEDRDLIKRVDIADHHTFEATIEGTMDRAGTHLLEHAETLSAITS